MLYERKSYFVRHLLMVITTWNKFIMTPKKWIFFKFLYKQKLILHVKFRCIFNPKLIIRRQPLTLSTLIDSNQLNPDDEEHFGSHGINGTDLVGWVPSSAYTSSLRGPFPQALTILGGVRFTSRRLRGPFLGECRRCLGYFGEYWVRLGYGPAPRPTLKRSLCHTRPVSGTADKYRWHWACKLDTPTP